MTIHSLAKLSWITRSNSGVSQKYIQSVKIPALEVIFDKEFESSTLRGIQKEISAITKLSMENIVTNRTGFTNFRPVFRNSSLAWCKQNEKKLINIFVNLLNLFHYIIPTSFFQIFYKMIICVTINIKNTITNKFY